MNKYTLSIILLSVMFGNGLAHAQSLVLWHSDGSNTEIKLMNQPLVRFVADKVLVTSKIINLEYDKNYVIRFTYKDIDTSISTSQTETDIEQKDGQIIFHNITSDDKVSIYKADGIRVPVQLVFIGSSAVLPLSQIPAGVYLFSVNGQTSKFTKK